MCLSSFSQESTLTMSSNPQALHVGVLLFNGAQLFDAAAVDLLGMLTPEYLQHCRLPDQLVALGQEMVFHYIAESRVEGEDSVNLTAAFGCKVTVSRRQCCHCNGRIDALKGHNRQRWPPRYHPDSRARLIVQTITRSPIIPASQAARSQGTPCCLYRQRRSSVFGHP